MSRMVKFASYVLVLVGATALVRAGTVNADHAAGTLDVSLTATAASAVGGGETRFVVTVQNGDHRPVANVAVSVIVEAVGQSGGHGASQHGSTELSFAAEPADRVGEYAANVKMPGEGEWKVTIVHGDQRAEFKVVGNQDSI